MDDDAPRPRHGEDAPQSPYAPPPVRRRLRSNLSMLGVLALAVVAFVVVLVWLAVT